ncbi:MAG: hypothetical protein WA650_17905, partial [Bradyrhizobium sp.]
MLTIALDSDFPLVQNIFRQPFANAEPFRLAAPEGKEERHMLGLRSSRSMPFGAPAGEPLADAADDITKFAGTGSEVERLRGLVAQLMQKTAHDPLTALPTRSVLLEQLEHELARDASDGAQQACHFGGFGHDVACLANRGRTLQHQGLRPIARDIG